MRRYLAIISVLVGCLLVTGWVSRSDALPLMAGDILVTDRTGIVSLNPVTGAHSVFSSVEAADIDTWGRDIFAIAGNTIVKIDPATGTGTTISSGGFIGSALSRVAVGPDSAVFTLGHIGGFGLFDGLIRINVKDGSQSVVASGLDGGVNDLSVGPDGKILVVTELGKIYTIDPISGAVQACCSDAHRQGVDIAAEGTVVLLNRGFGQLDGGPSVKPPEDFGPEGIIDVSWGLDNNLFFSTTLGVFHFDGHAEPPASGFVYSAISHDVHGRLTVFVPAPRTLLLVLIGLIGLGVFARTGSCLSK